MQGQHNASCRSPEHEPHRHSEPHGDGLVAASGWFKPPSLDGLRRRLVEVWVPSRALDLDVADSAVCQHLKEQLSSARNALSPC